MDEATWGDAANPSIAWQMSAALEDVRRGAAEVPEVTSLEGAVRAWSDLDAGDRATATLTPERPVLLNGVAHETFSGDAIAALAGLLGNRSDGAGTGAEDFDDAG